MNDKQRCEIMFVARIMHVIALTGCRFEAEGQHEKFVRTATDAVLEPVRDLPVRKAESIRRRVARMEDLTLKPACHKATAEKVLLIGYFFMEGLIEREYLIIHEGSPLRNVTDVLLEAVDLEDEVAQKRLKNGEKQARKWMEKLQSEGYFQ